MGMCELLQLCQVFLELKQQEGLYEAKRDIGKADIMKRCPCTSSASLYR